MQLYDPSSNPLNQNEWSFPMLEIIHILSIALSVGTIAIVDLRLLGAGMRRFSAAQLAESTELWTLWGIMLALLSGALLMSTDPNNYLHNPAFRFKLGCLMAAIAFHYTVHLKVASSQHPAVWGKVTGALSLLLWLSVVFSGIFYAFV